MEWLKDYSSTFASTELTRRKPCMIQGLAFLFFARTNTRKQYTLTKWVAMSDFHHSLELGESRWRSYNPAMSLSKSKGKT